MSQENIDIGECSDIVHADILVSVNQLFQCLRGHSQQCYVRISLNTDGHTVVFGEDKGRSNDVSRAQPRHLHLLPAERNHATDEASTDDDIGKSAGHTGQCVDIAGRIINKLIADIAQGKVYAEFAHAGEKRTSPQCLHHMVIYHSLGCVLL